jgi:hypothetical protein
MKILFVSHRFGYAGGTEQTIYRYANAAVELGHEAGVFAPDIIIRGDKAHLGKFEGVTVSNNPKILYDPWDMIVVHGDGDGQNQVLGAQNQVGGPVYYLVVRPDENLPIMKVGMQKATWIGCGTSADVAFVTKHGFQNKIRHVGGFPIDCPEIADPQSLRAKFDITEEKVYMACGGYWPHKRFEGIVDSFIKTKPPNTELILTGYDTRHGVPDFTQMGKDAGVKIQMYLLDNPSVVYQLMSLSDLFIWNSKPESEGYGLVLFECMFYNCPWVGIKTAAAIDMNGKGGVAYETAEELQQLMLNPPSKLDTDQAKILKDYVKNELNANNLVKILLSALDT